ncbi:hypothetical protein N8T08_006886 [Aspergillus melleus]|uniref:Uncharacterized protein n=1 Tax=Aspergillus melleus TaxID=138277 RepID=A0ACC3AYW7_9EURO|nr:hypothetical protein N8T08_006886 [Aspergillus melleus]
MPDLQIPNVALEDLQTFQAKHFPGSAQIPTTQYQYDETVDDSNGYDEDDLGYYPDGVKRTLTDEQIKIFRHSEIHTLLREKQLREEALEAAREEAEAEAEEEAKKATESRKATVSEAGSKEPTNHTGCADGRVAEDSVLDYGEDASVGNAPKQTRPGGQCRGKFITWTAHGP